MVLDIPTLSIMIPFYKGKEYLARAIMSVLSQTDAQWTLTIIDDCGPDGDVAEQVAAYKDSRIRYIRNDKNLGLGGNWNRCLDSAGSQLVTLLHNDDELRPNYVATMRKMFQSYPKAAIYFCQTEIIDGSGSKAFSFADYVKSFLIPKGNAPIHLQNEDGFSLIMRGDFIFCPTMCFNISVLGNRRFDTSLKFVADLNFIADVLLSEAAIIGSREICYAYRRHDSNTTVLMTANNQRFQEEIWCHKKFAVLAEAKGWRKGAKVARRYFMVRANILFNIVTDFFSFRFRGISNRLPLVFKP